jgi:hypothetical protein
MLKQIITLLLLLTTSYHVLASAPLPTSTSISSWLLLSIMGLGLPLLALFFNKKDK